MPRPNIVKAVCITVLFLLGSITTASATTDKSGTDNIINNNTSSLTYWETFVAQERDLVALPDEVVALSGIQPGDKVADVGSGAGYFTFRLARKTGPGGKVFAIEHELPNDMRNYFTNRVNDPKENPFANIDLIENRYDQMGLPESSTDVVFMCLTGTLLASPEKSITAKERHNLNAQASMVRSIYRALRPGGRLILIDLFHHPLSVYKRASVAKEAGIFESAKGIGTAISNYEEMGFRFLADHDLLRNNQHNKRIEIFKSLPVYKRLNGLEFAFNSSMFYLVFEKPLKNYQNLVPVAGDAPQAKQ
jgi:predicted methyltransferase